MKPRIQVNASILNIPPDSLGPVCANEESKSEMMDSALLRGSCIRAAWYFRKHVVLFKIFVGVTVAFGLRQAYVPCQ